MDHYTPQNKKNERDLEQREKGTVKKDIMCNRDNIIKKAFLQIGEIYSFG